ncbi:ubiquitin-protein ligase peroxin 12 [Yamadazyma tenuis]|uniref:Peroxisome assembly protein 12 n=1 Tax=Candida tenuis (strain ATCC 10573 / BCRC 21748 / CBS 615 / JCM 9827 / NBRC 10315 / NRRL Y-1498 / VKM Y-70) TaxID=590646 RepID=G3AYE0_CANTC|nr:uncharacterized protein CANTEDRAFT_112691 [Yamadazyma tenuis ATCC 10573]EGV65830.1 hypothetical protein CANTEDRAFT_112691 [Yamadazyma tenuis ATCC 10573]WEJ95840.1 ubiquitin-protein ligase peroxin 12 [Yamadazyma tenuis]
MEYYSSLDASQLDSESPTLFELISANQLESLLSPSLRYILVHYASKYPYYLLKVVNNFDELNLFLRSFIEWYFIRYWQGSFTENFYGLKRISQTPLSDPKYNSSKLTQLVPSLIEERRVLSSLQRFVSIFEVTGLAYINEKFTYWYEIWYPKMITNQLVPSDENSKADVYKTNLKKLFVKYYPYIQSIFKAANLIASLMYLSGNTKSPSLLTYLFKINFSRLNQYDYTKNEPRPIPKDHRRANRVNPPTTLEYLLRFLTNNLTRPSWKVLKLILGTFFPMAIFSLKFLEWWNNSNFSQRLKKNQGDSLESILPPPSLLTNLKAKPKSFYKSTKTCPLCQEEISNPAIIETGYVFCYSCIYNYLANSHKIVAAKSRATKIDDPEDSDSEKEEDDEGNEKPEKASSESFDLSKGGRCPITGKKLLGCKWNELKGEYDIEGIRRLVF